jgi:hypothetical protein
MQLMQKTYQVSMQTGMPQTKDIGYRIYRYSTLSNYW